MKPGKRDLDLRESEILDEVHRTEKEIDLYLREKEEEARIILAQAQSRVLQMQDAVSAEAEEKYQQEVGRLEAEAQRAAENVLADGERHLALEEMEVEERRDQVVARILELVLGTGS